MSDELPPPAGPPPGWYPDPAGGTGSRWWDGSAWTGHVREAPPSDDPPPPPIDDVPAVGGLPLSGSARSRRTGRTLAVLLGVALLASVGIAAWNAANQPPPLGQVRADATVPTPMERAEVAARQEDAGCEVTVDSPLEDRTHLDAAQAPPPDALYPDRPAHSGRHYGGLMPLPAGTPDAAIDERAVLHNMEHGSVVVWFDEERAPGLRQQIAAWRDARADLGFTSPAGGAVFASPMPRDVDDPPSIALRAWGVAMDCERFDPVVADAFLAEHWGSHGAAPESDLAPYPEDSLSFAEPA